MATTTAKLGLRKPDGTDLVNVLTDLDANLDIIEKMSRGELAYSSGTVTSAPFTAATDLFSVGPVTLIAAQRVLVIAELHVQTTVAGDTVTVDLREGATVLQTVFVDLRNANFPYHVLICKRALLGAGNWTPKITAARNTGTGNITMVASANTVFSLQVIDLGQA